MNPLAAVRSLAVPLAVVALVLIGPAARAHGELRSTTPKDGATLTDAPGRVSIDLTETPSNGAKVTVLDGCNGDVVGGVSAEQKILNVRLDEGRPGKWVVDYRVISKEDGHETSGSFSFTVTGKRDCSSASEPDDPDQNDAADPGGDIAAPDTGPDSSPGSDGSSLPVVPIAAGVVVLLGVAFVVRSASSK